MGSASTEINYCAAARDFYHPSRLGGDQRLEADTGQQIGLDDLRFQQRRANSEEWLARENRRAFPHREKIAREAKLAKGVEELLRDDLELRQRFQISDFFFSEIEFGQILDYLLETGGQNEVAVARQVAKK